MILRVRHRNIDRLPLSPPHVNVNPKHCGCSEAHSGSGVELDPGAAAFPRRPVRKQVVNKRGDSREYVNSTHEEDGSVSALLRMDVGAGAGNTVRPPGVGRSTASEVSSDD